MQELEKTSTIDDDFDTKSDANIPYDFDTCDFDIWYIFPCDFDI